MVNVGKFVELNIETAVHHRQFYQELDLQKDQHGSERKSCSFVSYLENED